MPAGSALLYPSTCYHAVTPVSNGERLVAVTWVQSHIRRADQREILMQLDQAKTLLARSFEDRQSESYQKINLCYANLFRLWADAITRPSAVAIDLNQRCEPFSACARSTSLVASAS